MNRGRLWRVYVRSLLRYGSITKIVNALRTELAYRRRRIVVPSRPYILFIEPLYYCNLRCPLCPRETARASSRLQHGGRLPLEMFDEVLKQIGNDLFQCQIFGNGEPMLDWPRTREIIQRAHRRRIFTLVSTNATLITGEMAAEIVSSPLDYLIFAIDGISQESYERYRVGGKLEDALNGMRAVADAKRKHRTPLMLEWQFLVNRFNQSEMSRATAMANDLGVYIRFSPLRGVGENPSASKYWLPDALQWRETCEAGRPRRDFHCYWLWRSVVINSQGQLGRCPGYSNVAQLGSLKDRSIMSLYNGPESRRSRQLFVKGQVPPGPFPWPCQTCAHFDRHHGGVSLPISQTPEFRQVVGDESLAILAPGGAS